MPHGGVGHRLADLCARLATWLHAPAKESGERGPRSVGPSAAPHRPLLLPQWPWGGEIHKATTTHPKYKARVGSWSLLVAASSTEPAPSGRWALLYDGLEYSGSEPGKSMYPLGDLRHVSLHEPSLGNFDAASTDRYTT